MHINCPHCHNGVEVVEEASLTEIDCPSCGSHFSLLGEDPDATLEGGYAQRTLGRFELINEVGVGAFGSVWRGKDPQLDRTVAVKIPRKGQLNQAESEQFFREARAVAQLKHPNIVPVHEIGKDGDTIYIVSDFVEGISLAGRTKAAPLSMRESAELCIKVCRALDHAHGRGVIHRDLKPDNIMLNVQDEPYVMDFGLAKREAGEITMTVDGQILGTPAYMSPEQAGGAAHDVDGRSDLYSVGVILFELLTGELPFRGNQQMLIHQVINEDAPNPLKLNFNIDKDLATIATKCLEKKPGNRYTTATDLADDFQRYLDGRPINARPISRLERGWRWCKRKPALAGAFAVSTFLLTALAIGGPLAAWRQAELKEWANIAALDAQNEKDRANEEAENARKAEFQARDSAKRSSNVLKIVTDAFKSANPDSGSTAQMTAKDVLTKAHESVGDSALDAQGKIDVLSALTSSFLGLGEFQLAVSTAEEELSLNKANFSGNHLGTLRAMNDLAAAYREVGRNKESIELLEKTLANRTAILGPDHLTTLETMSNLANSYFSAGQRERALDLDNQTYVIRKKTLGADHPTTLKSMNNLAASYHAIGRIEEALKLREETLELRSKALGPRHPDTLMAMDNLATSYDVVGRGNEALQLREKTVELQTEVLGPDHPAVLRSMNNLANSYDSSNRIDKAIEIREKTLDLITKKLGAEHQQTIISMIGSANSFYLGKQTGKAVELSEKAYALALKNLGSDHQFTLVSASRLATYYSAAGRNAEALELREKTLAQMKKVLGDSNVETLKSMNNLANSYLLAGRNDAAIELFESAFKIMGEKFGAKHMTTLTFSVGLASALTAAEKQPDRAILLSKQAMKVFEAELGPDHPYTLAAKTNIANGHVQIGELEIGIEILEELVTQMKKVFGKSNPDTRKAIDELEQARAKLDEQ